MCHGGFSAHLQCPERDTLHPGNLHWLQRLSGLFLALFWVTTASASSLLVPMDEPQRDHLRAYGLAYRILEFGGEVEWLLNYRGGSFLLSENDQTKREALVYGVTVVSLDAGTVSGLRTELAAGNKKSILLEKAPIIAVYCPPSAEPWDDAVRLALEYARIPYDTVWDSEILAGGLEKYDWLHLHHEDFTGQYGKFYATFGQAQWYRTRKAQYEADAAAAGFSKVSAHKGAVALVIRHYVEEGGFLFAMCSATDTIDISLSALKTDIVHEVFDGDPVAPGHQKALDYSRTLAFTGFRVFPNPLVYEFSDIDTTPERTRVPRELDYFRLFDFSAQFDPVPCMLTQCHVRFVKGFMGQTTGYNARMLKADVIRLGETPKTNEVKYLHGNLGKGTFTFLGGHDPEDYQHLVGDPPTDLNLKRNSPGYRLILNNVLFPAARKQERKT